MADIPIKSSIDLGGSRIKNVGTAVSSADAVPLAQAKLIAAGATSVPIVTVSAQALIDNQVETWEQLHSDIEDAAEINSHTLRLRFERDEFDDVDDSTAIFLKPINRSTGELEPNTGEPPILDLTDFQTIHVSGFGTETNFLFIANMEIRFQEELQQLNLETIALLPSEILPVDSSGDVSDNFKGGFNDWSSLRISLIDSSLRLSGFTVDGVSPPAWADAHRMRIVDITCRSLRYDIKNQLGYPLSVGGATEAMLLNLEDVILAPPTEIRGDLEEAIIELSEDVSLYHFRLHNVTSINGLHPLFKAPDNTTIAIGGLELSWEFRSDSNFSETGTPLFAGGNYNVTVETAFFHSLTGSSTSGVTGGGTAAGGIMFGIFPTKLSGTEIGDPVVEYENITIKDFSILGNLQEPTGESTFLVNITKRFILDNVVLGRTTTDSIFTIQNDCVVVINNSKIHNTSNGSTDFALLEAGDVGSISVDLKVMIRNSETETGITAFYVTSGSGTVNDAIGGAIASNIINGTEVA